MGICGIDEAGRGPLAGPVTAAAVILPRPGKLGPPQGPADSKQLSAEDREALALEIHACAIVGIGWASVEEIDLHQHSAGDVFSDAPRCSGIT